MERYTPIWGTLILIIFSTTIILWIWILVSESPLDRRLASLVHWPVACSTRGCVTTKHWHRQHALTNDFTNTAETDPIQPEQSLTTVIRNHLLRYASMQSPVTLADASRYRETILHITQEEQLRQITDISLEEYDRIVILPFLQQEALRQELAAGSTEDLYVQLSRDRSIFILPIKLQWDADTGEVAHRKQELPKSGIEL